MEKHQTYTSHAVCMTFRDMMTIGVKIIIRIILHQVVGKTQLQNNLIKEGRNPCFNPVKQIHLINNMCEGKNSH